MAFLLEILSVTHVCPSTSYVSPTRISQWNLIGHRQQGLRVRVVELSNVCVHQFNHHLAANRSCKVKVSGRMFQHEEAVDLRAAQHNKSILRHLVVVENSLQLICCQCCQLVCVRTGSETASASHP